MTVYVADPDFVLHQGEALEVLFELADASVDCVVTSPPYWGLRDYGTGAWDDGDPDCDHKRFAENPTGRSSTLLGGKGILDVQTEGLYAYREVCGKCGARRVDDQLGLESTPALYVDRLVAIFAELWRVLAPHGTAWLVLGDSYANSGDRVNRNGTGASTIGWPGQRQETLNKADGMRLPAMSHGLKQKDLVGIPWRVAFALQEAGWYLRCDVVWAKPNPMPESIVDRPTKAHEYVFLLAKRSRYYYDAEAIKEEFADGRLGNPGAYRSLTGEAAQDDPHLRRYANAGKPWNEDGAATGRNARSFWVIATTPYADAHFATYPPELVRRCLLAGCPELVCRRCGRPRERLVERKPATPAILPSEASEASGRPRRAGFYDAETKSLGWSDCGCAYGLEPDALELMPLDTLPPELAHRAIAAGCPEQVCRTCGKPRERVVERTKYEPPAAAEGERFVDASRGDKTRRLSGADYNRSVVKLGESWSECGCAYGLEPDPSLVTGRAGYNRPRGEDEGTRPIYRFQQRALARQLRDSPHRSAMETEAGGAFAHYLRVDRTGARPPRPDLLEAWLERGWVELPALPERVGTNYRPGRVLDPFLGSGTTALVARRLGLHSIGVELSPEFCELAARRLQQLSLFADEVPA